MGCHWSVRHPLPITPVCSNYFLSFRASLHSVFFLRLCNSTCTPFKYLPAQTPSCIFPYLVTFFGYKITLNFDSVIADQLILFLCIWTQEKIGKTEPYPCLIPSFTCKDPIHLNILYLGRALWHCSDSVSLTFQSLPSLHSVSGFSSLVPYPLALFSVSHCSVSWYFCPANSLPTRFINSVSPIP